MNSDDDSEISEKGNFGVDNITRVAINRVKRDTQPKLPRPWELHGKDTDEYWQGCPTGYPYRSVKIFPCPKLHIRMQIKMPQNLAIY